MNYARLQNDVQEIKAAIEEAITTNAYRGRKFGDGVDAKNALIRSSTLIMRIHETAKMGLADALSRAGIDHTVQPPIAQNSPELDVWGLLKKKTQDIVLLSAKHQPRAELIKDGPLSGEYDLLGKDATANAIVVGVRSQLSSVDKNFDTLMERAFAETTNLRMRHPDLVMGEVYMLAVREYDDKAMRANQVRWKPGFTNVPRFITLFNAMSGRKEPTDLSETYKYERSALVLVDFSTNPVTVFRSQEDLISAGVLNRAARCDYSNLTPESFSDGIVESYLLRHNITRPAR